MTTTTGSNGGGRKDDSEKLRYDLIPPSTLHALASVLTFGAKKYDARNWEKGIAWGRVFGALMRHLWAWWAREPYDPETGFSHLWHAQCCLSFLMEYEVTHPELDDRPPMVGIYSRTVAEYLGRISQPSACSTNVFPSQTNNVG